MSVADIVALVMSAVAVCTMAVNAYVSLSNSRALSRTQSRVESAQAQIVVLHGIVNSRMSEMIEYVKAASRLQGQKDSAGESLPGPVVSKTNQSEKLNGARIEDDH